MKTKLYLFVLFAQFFSMTASAYDAEIDGIYYNFNGTEATVTNGDNRYSGDIVIPQSVTYNDNIYDVTSIGASTFYRCTGLTSITIPGDVTSIEKYAFWHCEGLTSITIPENLTFIGEGAFSGCYGLTSITIPENLTFIGEGAFSGCYGLTSITIPENLTFIGEGAFSGCEGLTSITIPESVTSIGENAFSNCYGLTSITIPESVTNIGASAFRRCYGLTSIVVENGNSVYDSRNDCNALIETTSNTLIQGCMNTIIPESVTSIGEGAFSGCEGLTSITIPESVTSIGENAFLNCFGLTSITIPENVTTIGNSAFFQCWRMTSVTIPEGVTTIGSGAFSSCSNLASVTIPKSVTSIGEAAFLSCRRLTSIIVKEGNEVYDSRNGCNAIIETASNALIAGCINTIIPESVTSIGEGAFSGCDGLTSITIPEGVTSIGDYAFYNTPWYENQPDGMVYAGKVAYKYKGTMPENTAIEIKEGTLGIAGGAFSGCTGLISITIPESVTSVGGAAFYGCTGLTSIIIPEGVTSIGSNAFSGCTGLTSITIPEGVTSIGSNAFSGCTGLTSITIPEGVTSIGGAAFSGCTGLTSVIIPEGVTSIGSSAFVDCSNLKTVTLPSSVTEIGSSAFVHCRSLSIVKAGMKTPVAITENTFNDYMNSVFQMSLYVPRGTAAAYKAADIWKDFKYIIEYNYVQVSNLGLLAGGSATMEIGLKNEETNLVGFQMDLTLPEGVGIDKTGCKLSSRITDEEQELTIGKLESGAYRLTSTSMSLTPINGQSGTLLTLKFTATEDCAGGQVTFSDIRFSTSDSKKVTMRDESFDIYMLYTLKYKVDGEVYQTDSIEYHAPLAHVDKTPLITDVEQFSSPVSDPWEGNFDALIDSSDSNGFWHSDWRHGDQEPGTHYLQVEMTEPEDLPELIKFEFKRRNVYDDHTTEWRVMGTDNPDAPKEDCKELAYIRTPFTNSGETLSSEPFNPRHYRYLRFYSEKQEGFFNGSRGYFHIARFQLYPAAVSHPILEKEGHTFAGWEGLPETMPNHDVEVSVAFTVNSYALLYIVDGEEYLTDSVAYNTQPVYEAGPTKDGYTFAWDNWPETMPAHDVEVTGRFYLYGDVNTDEEVDVVDVVDIARFVVATPSDSFREKLADLNFDNTVNIADAVTLVNHIAGDQNFVKAAQPIVRSNDATPCLLQLQNSGQKALSLCLNGDTDFTAFQFEVELPANTDISAMHINAQRKNGHQLLYHKVSDNRYRVAALSLSNAVFKGSEGELLNISIDGLPTDDVCIRDIHFVKANGTDVTFDGLSVTGTITGITEIVNSESSNCKLVYDLQGRRRTTLQRGLNIVGNKKIIKK